MTLQELIDFMNNDNYCSDFKCLDDNCKECQKKYFDRFLAEHDKQIRAEVIEEVLKRISEVIPFLNNDQLTAYFNICDKICELKEQK